MTAVKGGVSTRDVTDAPTIAEAVARLFVGLRGVTDFPSSSESVVVISPTPPAPPVQVSAPPDTSLIESDGARGGYTVPNEWGSLWGDLTSEQQDQVRRRRKVPIVQEDWWLQEQEARHRENERLAVLMLAAMDED